MLNLHPDIFSGININYPASNEFINGLPISKVTSQFLAKNKNDCSICLASFEHKEEIVSLPCYHSYHLICLKVWLSKVS